MKPRDSAKVYLIATMRRRSGYERVDAKTGQMFALRKFECFQCLTGEGLSKKEGWAYFGDEEGRQRALSILWRFS
jgi:hypothetical protein